VLRSPRFGKGHLSGGDRSTPPRACWSPLIVGEEHYQNRAHGQQVLQRYKSLQDIIAISGMDELPKRTRSRWARGPQDRASFLSQPFFRRRSSSRDRRASFVDSADTIKGFRAICEGKYDHLPESAFYMVGTIRRSRREGKKLARKQLKGRSWRKRRIRIGSGE